MAINKNNHRRYPGPEPFSSEQSNIFFGRDADIAAVLELLNLQKHLLIYAKSGIGKSSLLNAGVLPAIEKRTDIQVEKFSFGLYTDNNAIEKTPLSESIGFVQKMIRAASPEEGNSSFYLDKIIFRENSLWYNLKNLQRLLPEGCRIVLIIDQFEELFSYPEDDIILFKRLLSEALFRKIPPNFHEAFLQRPEIQKKLSSDELRWFNRPLDFRVVFAIRSDRLSQLNQLADALPDIVKNFYEVKPLTPEQARAAIVQPAALDGGKNTFESAAFRYSEDLLEQLLDTLGKTKEKYIETFQIQLICGQIEDDVIANPRSQVDLKDENINLNNFLLVFYENCLNKLPVGKRDIARHFIEHALLIRTGAKPDKNGIRRPVFLAEIQRDYPDMDDKTLRILLDTRLIREEPDAAMNMRYEISHDTLIEPILNAKDSREEALGRKEKLLQRKREAYEEARSLRHEIGSKRDYVNWEQLVYDIQDQRVIVLIGDQAISNSKGELLGPAMYEYLSYKGDELIDFYYQEDQLFYFRNTISEHRAKRLLMDFFENFDYSVKEMDILASLPIRLVISLEQSLALATSFARNGRKFKTVVLDRPNLYLSEDREKPSKELPWLFHLLGRSGNDDSMALTYEDVFRKMRMIMNDEIPLPVQQDLREAQSIILLGVDFNKSYILLLLWALFSYNRQVVIYAIASKEQPEGNIREQMVRVHRIRPLEMSINDFLSQLQDHTESINLLYSISNKPSKFFDSVRRSIIELDVERALLMLEDYSLKQHIADGPKLELVHLIGRFRYLESEYIKGTVDSRDLQVQRNQITYSLLKILDELQSQNT